MHTRVGIIMGSRSEWSTMIHAAKLLAKLGIAYEGRIITASRNRSRLDDYASNAVNRGLELIITGSTGAAHLPEIIASSTDLPVLVVPIEAKGHRSRMAKELNPYNDTCNPIGILTTGQEGAVNAALLAASMLGTKYPHIRENLLSYCGTEQSANKTYTN